MPQNSNLEIYAQTTLKYASKGKISSDVPGFTIFFYLVFFLRTLLDDMIPPNMRVETKKEEGI